MTEKDKKQHVKRFKAEPTFPDSPIKSKADMNSMMDMILKKLLDVHDLTKSTKTNTDSMQLELTAIRADINIINIRVSEAEQRISDLEDARIKTDKELRFFHASTSSMRRNIADLEDRNRRGNLRIFGLPEDPETKEDSINASPFLRHGYLWLLVFNLMIHLNWKGHTESHLSNSNMALHPNLDQ
ncbi:hypothetical protein NDU88_005372 [Pleurodeles waltl]|uniref:Uncharacterized protein n=1 Tax=Pleurodeles waltl TaxID=8319 RepID=A0AAV7N0A9_PLEWA|nr:hypothetical protein NDU88_005372 [Pleurodeles waltl]